MTAERSAPQPFVPRPYEQRDYKACRALWVELTEHHREIYDDPTIGAPDPGAALDPYLAALGDGELWVAEHDGHVIAMAGLLDHGEEGEVEPIVVTREWRSTGVGSQLLDHVVQRARERGTRWLSIRPVARNERAIARFHASGFRTLGHVDMFMELGDSDRTWRSGISIHGLDLRF